MRQTVPISCQRGSKVTRQFENMIAKRDNRIFKGKPPTLILLVEIEGGEHGLEIRNFVRLKKTQRLSC